jgi:hypothetical protein
MDSFFHVHQVKPFKHDGIVLSFGKAMMSLDNRLEYPSWSSKQSAGACSLPWTIPSHTIVFHYPSDERAGQRRQQ